MAKKGRARVAPWLIFVVIFLFLQITDFYIPAKLEVIKNSQAIFGQYGCNLLAIITSLLCVATLHLFVAIYDKHNLWLVSAVITACALSNVLDRIFYGGVVDYIAILNFPRFNLADIGIVAALALMAYEVIKPDPHKKKSTAV